ncbi:MAG: DUF4166 domain-containing protein [Rhodoglobus sp.]
MRRPRSPWERALGAEIDDLDPALRAYFGPIPRGSVGYGEGVFEVVGTPRRWLWPLLAILAVDGIVYPTWAHQVAFSVTNTPSSDGTVRAKRRFEFPHTGWVMTDEIGITSGGLTDRLGRNGYLAATLSAAVVEGGLVLRSTGVTLRIGSLRVPFGVLSPRLVLVERTEGDRQHVSMRLHLPLIGTLYEYAGSFRYAIEAAS